MFIVVINIVSDLFVAVVRCGGRCCNFSYFWLAWFVTGVGVKIVVLTAKKQQSKRVACCWFVVVSMVVCCCFFPC